MKKINSSKKLVAVQLLLIFLIMLVANYYTYYICDDFGYFFHCATGEPLSFSLKEHIESIVDHTNRTNGRYIAHFIAQYMLNLPKIVFNILNALMFTLQILLCYRLCKKKGQQNNILLLGIFGATWVYEPLMGQTNLWVMGSCNYLWALVAVLAFIYPVCRYYLDGTKINKIYLMIMYQFLAFIAGAFNEAASATGIFIIAAILFISAVIEKKKIPWYFITALLIAVCGYMSMIFAPSEINAKASTVSLYSIVNNFVTCVTMYKGFMPIIIAWIILFITAIYVKADKRAVLFSVLMLVGSLFANFIFVMAAYYPGHCAGTSMVFLLIATGILADAAYRKEERQFSLIIPAVIVPLMCYNLVVGLNDIHFTNYQARLTVEYIDNCKENGITTVLYPEIEAQTTYSAYYGMPEMNHDDPNSWPNSFMAKYFGVDEVKAVDSIRDIPEIQEIAWR